MEKVKAFASITEDFNPVHLDPVYAGQTIFKGNIVHGFLVGSLFSAILGTKMPERIHLFKTGHEICKTCLY